MAERGAGGFGSRLRQARERRGISIREIATATKLSVSALEALERNDISRLPGGIFSRSIVRAYAIEVGLEPEATIQEFVTQFPLDSVTAGHPPSVSVVDAEDNRVIEGERRSASVFLWLFLVSVPVAGVLLYFSIAGRPGEPAEAVVSEPAPQGTALPAPVLPPAVPAAAVALAAAPASAEHLSVVLTASVPGLVSVVLDGQPIPERRLDAGSRQMFDVQQEVVLTVSDPSAVSLTINGAAARIPGAPGTPAVVTVTPANYKQYLTRQ